MSNNILNCMIFPNGILNLENGEFTAKLNQQYHTQINYEFNPFVHVYKLEKILIVLNILKN